MGAAGKVALISFVRFLPPDSALNRGMNPKDEFAVWYTTYKTNQILADLVDLYIRAHTKKGRQPKEYPRPRKKKAYGRGALPIKEFWKWWNKGSD